MENGHGTTYSEQERSRNGTIKSFRDLHVYQNLYKAMVRVHREFIPSLPKEERYDLRDQMGRASKAGPALIAEGFAKRYQVRQWRKYLNDAQGECNEMIHHLSVCIDVYDRVVNVQLCKELIDTYDISCKQITKLGQVWKDFHDERRSD